MTNWCHVTAFDGAKTGPRAADLEEAQDYRQADRLR